MIRIVIIIFVAEVAGLLAWFLTKTFVPCKAYPSLTGVLICVCVFVHFVDKIRRNV